MLTPRQLVYRAALLKELQQHADSTLQFPHPLFRADGNPAPAGPATGGGSGA